MENNALTHTHTCARAHTHTYAHYTLACARTYTQHARARMHIYAHRHITLARTHTHTSDPFFILAKPRFQYCEGSPLEKCFSITLPPKQARYGKVSIVFLTMLHCAVPSRLAYFIASTTLSLSSFHTLYMRTSPSSKTVSTSMDLQVFQF